MQYKMGGNPCGLVLCLGSLEKTDRFRLGGTGPFGFLRREAGCSVVVMIISGESQGSRL